MDRKSEFRSLARILGEIKESCQFQTDIYIVTVSLQEALQCPPEMSG